jgi:hypothetical protein
MGRPWPRKSNRPRLRTPLPIRIIKSGWKNPLCAPGGRLRFPNIWVTVLLLGSRLPAFPHPDFPGSGRAVPPEISSGFLPHRFEPEDSLQLAGFKALASRLRMDSTRHWSVAHGRLEISHDLLQELAAGGGAIQWGRGPAQGLADFLRQAHGIRLHPSLPGFGRYVPDDSLFPVGPQWALINPGIDLPGAPAKAGVDVNVEKVWDQFSGSDSLVIAVVDAGFNFSHPDLAGRHWVNEREAKGAPGVDDDGNGFVDDSIGWDFVDNDNRPDDYHGHGTMVSSVIAANFDNRMGVAGVLAQGKIMPVRVLDASGHGDQNDIAKGILYAVNNGASVINFSIGGGGDNTALKNAFQTAHSKGVPIVAAAGNDSVDLDKHPAFPSNLGLDNVVMVAAHNPMGAISPFSNFGATTVHLAAPGEKILVCSVPGRKSLWTEGFESGLGNWKVTGGLSLSTAQPLEGKQSLVWTAGNNDTAVTAGFLDLTAVKGATLRFLLTYAPASAFDALIVEGNREGTSQWVEIAVFAQPAGPDAAVTFGLQDLDGSRFKLRLRTALTGLRSSAGRALKLDGLDITHPDPNPPSPEIYDVAGGTSLAAPHVAAYLGLQRLACDRMGLTWTRARALEGVTPEAELAGKMSTGARLNMYKGLSFYLSTLPSLRVRDSTALAWHTGETAQYLVDVFPAPPQAYRLSDSGLGADAQLDSAAGKLTWLPRKAGAYALTLLAEGPTVLRKRMALNVQVPVVTRAAPGQSAMLRLGYQAFRLPDLPSGRKAWLEIFGTDALGRSKLLKRGWVVADEGGATWPEMPENPFAFRRLRVFLDGRELPEAR